MGGVILILAVKLGEVSGIDEGGCFLNQSNNLL